MSLRELIIEKMSRYTLREVDQLSEGVVEFCERVFGGNSEFEGGWADAEVVVTYRVDTEICRTGAMTWRFRGTLDDLINELDGMK